LHLGESFIIYHCFTCRCDTMVLRLDEWRRIEEEGRRRAFEKDKLPLSDPSFLERLGMEAEKSGRDLGKAIGEAALALSAVADVCLADRIPREDCQVPDYAREVMRKLDEVARRELGRRCTWLLGIKEPYNLSSAINDITACFHRLIEVEEAGSSALTRVGRRVFVREYSGP